MWDGVWNTQGGVRVTQNGVMMWVWGIGTQNGVRVWVWGVVSWDGQRVIQSGGGWGGVGGSVGWSEGGGKEHEVTATNPHPNLPPVLSGYTEQ